MINLALTAYSAVERNTFRRSSRAVRRGLAFNSRDVIAFGRFVPGDAGTYAGFYVLRDSGSEYVTHLAYLIDDRPDGNVGFESGHYFQDYDSAMRDLVQR